MAHDNQDNFCKWVKQLYPQFFDTVSVLDAGSLDVNGNNRKYFITSQYIGLDLGEGNNVDVISPIEDYYPNRQFDVVISTEMLEHCRRWSIALESMYNLTRSGGLLLITCASEGRSEHGTPDNQQWASPFTGNYYRNISMDMFGSTLFPSMFDTYYLNNDKHFSDLQFYGIKR